MSKGRPAPKGPGGEPPSAERRRRISAWLKRYDSGFSRAPHPGSVRVFHPLEIARLSPDARGMLIRMTEEGAITQQVREEALNAALWLEQPEIGAHEMDQIVRFVLDRKPSGPPAAAPGGATEERDPAGEARPDPKSWN